MTLSCGMRICVVGNSVGYKMRPPRASPDDLTYAEILAKAGHQVHNASMAGALLSEQFSLLDDDVLTAFPDVVILHHGVIEVFYRRTFRQSNNAAIRNQYRNRVLRQGYTPSRPSVALRAFNAATRGIASAIGWRWQWQAPAVFLGVLQHTCALILKETSAFIVIVGITPSSQKVEADLPGQGSEIARVNSALRDYAVGLGSRAAFLDVAALVPPSAHEELVPDGIHFSAEGHRRVGAALLRTIELRRTV